jgi:DNA polymerase III alpha subunit (gram-positive type)
MAEYFVIIDIETTGFNPFHDEIIEIAAVDSLGESFQTLIKIGKPLPTKIKEITKITDEMLLEGVSTKKALIDLNDFLNRKSEIETKYILGHNLLNFDLPFLNAKYKKYKIPNLLHNFYFVDTLRISQYILPERYSHSMSSLCNLFSVVNSSEHRAFGDVATLHTILNYLFTLFKERKGIEGLKAILETISL